MCTSVWMVILVLRGRAPFGQNQESPPFTDLPSLYAYWGLSMANVIGWEYETNSLRMLRKLDLPRGRDSWRWPKGTRYLGTRMHEWPAELLHEHSTRIGKAFVFDHELYAYYRFLVLNLQTLPDITMHPDMSKYKFLNKRVSFHYYDNGTRRDHYHVIQSQAIPRKNIKSTKSGKVSLTFKWKDCGAWIDIKSIE